MDITKIDKNFKQREITNFKSNTYNLPNEKFTLLGGYFDKTYGFIKMPYEIASKVSEGVGWASRCGAGIRVLFSTDSKSIKICSQLFDKCIMQNMAFFGSSCFTLCECVGDKEIFICNLCPDMIKENNNFVAEGTLKGGNVRDYILYFPLYTPVVSVSIELNEGSVVKPFNKYIDMPPILYYGSSITQGGCASKPNNCYEALVGEWNKIDYYVLGFSGSAKAEQPVLDFMRDIKCSIFVCDYDYNSPTLEYLQQTHLNVYKTFRSGINKTTPIIFISKPDAFHHPGDKKRYKVVKETYEYAILHGDKNVYLINGGNIFPKAIREHCYVDGCHPNDLGFYYFAKKVDKVVKEILAIKK